MTIKNSKQRYIKDCNSHKIPFNLKRYYCPNCNQMHTELPDLIKPYRQYEQSVIDAVQHGHIDTFAGDDSTIRYWKGKK